MGITLIEPQYSSRNAINFTIHFRLIILTKLLFYLIKTSEIILKTYFKFKI